jgi:polyisoprenoid-binding protein YceI
MKRFFIPLILIIIAGGVYFYGVNSPGKFTESESGENAGVDAVITEESGQENQSDEDAKFKTAYEYKIASESSVSYKLTKLFFEKESEVVVGTTGAIRGSGKYYPQTQSAEGEAYVDLTTLKTDSNHRDEHVAGLFDPKEAKITFSENDFSERIEPAKVQSQTLTAYLTINGITHPVEFNVKTLVTREEFEITGTGTINLEDYNIDPPSILNVYKADDELTLEMDINGRRTN